MYFVTFHILRHVEINALFGQDNLGTMNSVESENLETLRRKIYSKKMPSCGNSIAIVIHWGEKCETAGLATIWVNVILRIYSYYIQITQN